MFRHRRLILIINLSLLSFLLIILTLRTNEHKSPSLNSCLENNITSNDNVYSNLVYIPSLNILFCDIPKAASTNLRRLIYGYFNQSKSYMKLDRKHIWIDYEDFFKQFYLTNKAQFDSLNINRQKLNLFLFLIVRHPFQRIYSVYYDKFVNNHLDDTLFGWKQFEEEILLEMKTNETLITIRRYDLRLDFRTFLLYIIHSIKTNRLINSHWEQITHRCALCFIHYDFIGKIENFHHDGKFLSNKFNQKSRQISLEFPSKELDQKQQKQISLNDYQLIELFQKTIQNNHDFQVLIDYYKPDFQIFNYTMPYL